MTLHDVVLRPRQGWREEDVAESEARAREAMRRGNPAPSPILSIHVIRRSRAIASNFGERQNPGKSEFG